MAILDRQRTPRKAIQINVTADTAARYEQASEEEKDRVADMVSYALLSRNERAAAYRQKAQAQTEKAMQRGLTPEKWDDLVYGADGA